MKPVYLSSALPLEECVRRIADLVDPRLPEADWQGEGAKGMLLGWQDREGFHVVQRHSPEVDPGVCVRGRWAVRGSEVLVRLQPSLTAHGIRLMLLGWLFVPLLAAAVWFALSSAEEWPWGSPAAGFCTIAAMAALFSLIVLRVLGRRAADELIEAIAEALDATELPTPPIDAPEGMGPDGRARR